MERNNRGPGNFEFNAGMRNKVQIYAKSVKSPSAFQYVKRGGDACRPGSAESSGKGCYRNLFPRSKSIHFQHFYHPEEGWGEKASGRHARAKSGYRVSSIQDGGYITTEGYPSERRLHDKAGFARRLFDYSSRSKIKDLFKIFLEGRALSVHMSTIQPLSIGKVVYQDIEASDCLSEIHGDSSTDLLRRHPHNGRFSGASCRAHRNSDKGLGVSRLRDKEEEVSLEANPDYPVSRFHCKFDKDAPSIARRKPAKIKVICSISSKKCAHSQRGFKFLGSVPGCSASIALHFRAIQRDLIQVISRQGDKVNYKKTISLSEDAIKDLLWWTQDPAQANGRVIIPPTVDSVIFSDASKIGWGAHLLQISIGGCWKELEALDHINYLELKAAYLALRAFLPLIRGNHVQFGLDNRSAVAYINRLGGTRSQHLTALALDIWCYTLDRNMVISAIHVPGKWNCIADGKSRIFHDLIEWMLDHNLFKQVTKHLGLPVVDLFASRVNHQMPEFVSWRPEPGAIATDAFNIPWDFPLSYLFPLFCLIPMCLRKVMQEQVDCILIAPVWRSQPWFPALLSMLIEHPLLLPQGQRILRLPGTDKIHPLCCQKKFQLAAWKISGKAYKAKAFWRKCQKFYYPPGEVAQPSNMRVLGKAGVAGVVKKRSILFLQL